MVHFKILSQDGYVQESAFADGTQIIVNFSRDCVADFSGSSCKNISQVAPLGPESWQVVK